jgi:hypothetical protein
VCVRERERERNRENSREEVSCASQGSGLRGRPPLPPKSHLVRHHHSGEEIADDVLEELDIVHQELKGEGEGRGRERRA